jgi:class 3 adenylate cyclase
LPAPQPVNHRTESRRTVLFADVCDSTRLYERRGEGVIRFGHPEARGDDPLGYVVR